MAPDEDAMPDPSGTGAVGAPSPEDPAATPGLTTPATPPTPGQGSNAGAPVDSGAPLAGATGAPPTG